MRQSLIDLIDKTILYKYELLPNSEVRPRTIFSTLNDRCYSAESIDDVVSIIYNSIIDYSYNEFDISDNDLSTLHFRALQNKIRYDESDSDLTQLKYGFFGEVLLYSVLLVLFKVKPLIARGYFYDPLSNSETKGYDAYHLIENDGKTELWFGEVKFHKSYTTAVKSALENVKKAISDNYLESNVFALQNQKNNLNISGSQIGQIIDNWQRSSTIKLIDEIKKNDMTLVYPVMLLYDKETFDYDVSIAKVPKHIKEKYTVPDFPISIQYQIFFILLPLDEVTKIKKEVLSWIESRKPLIS
ncbi:MAG: SAVED domain-containing protein [Cyclobacteriaceae bacterium]